MVAGEANDAWEEARLLAAWLRARPGVKAVVVCRQFESGYFRFVVDSILKPGAAARVGILGLPARDYDATNWWRSRSGVKDFMFSWLQMAYARYGGQNRPVVRRQSLDAYQATLRDTFRHAAG